MFIAANTGESESRLEVRPDSTFVLEAIIKALMPKMNSSQVIKLMDRDRVTQPRGEYRV